MNNSAVVLLSGGQDSTTCLYWALEKYDRVEAVSFDYGQRHKIELELAAHTAAKVGIAHMVLPMEVLKTLGGGSLTNPMIQNTEGGAVAPDGWHARHGLPPSFVPGRNLMFFSAAASYAIPQDINTFVTGVCQTDHAGYPDCRKGFVDAMQNAIEWGLDVHGDFTIDAPLLNRSKAETWQLAQDLGVLDEIILNTNTCYEGTRGVPHIWGHGCGTCGACTERRLGYEAFRLAEGERKNPVAV